MLMNCVPEVKEETKPPEKKQIEVGKEAAMEAEVRAARERAIVPLETRIKSFREMLAEKEARHISFYSVVWPGNNINYCVFLISGVRIQHMGEGAAQNCL